jgi:chromate reductase, NAD(P)H dehydrogenase (quinone)
MQIAPSAMVVTIGAVHVVSWCGSLGSRSANSAALEVALTHLATTGVETALVEGLESIPAFLPGSVDHPPAEVARFRTTIEEADAILLAAPEYAGGLAGVIKNALDWMVGSASLYEKPVAVLSAGTTGGGYALEQLVRTLSWQGAFVVATLGIAAPRTKMDDEGTYTDPATRDQIRSWAGALVAAHGATPADRLAIVSGIVSRYGIDPARFGGGT